MGLTMIIPTKVQTLLDFKMTIINMLTSLTTMGTCIWFTVDKFYYKKSANANDFIPRKKRNYVLNKQQRIVIKVVRVLKPRG
jgi:hypothetical protein